MWTTLFGKKILLNSPQQPSQDEKDLVTRGKNHYNSIASYYYHEKSGEFYKVVS
jgi:hypothetical protein